MKYLFCTIGLFFLLSPVTMWAEETSVPPATMVTAKEEQAVYSDLSKPINVTADKPQFIIKLPANPTTGYSWFTKSYDRNLLQLVKQYYLAPKVSMPGKGGFAYWYFEVKPEAFHGAFVSKIQLVYARPWEMANGKIANVFVITQSKH